MKRDDRRPRAALRNGSREWYRIRNAADSDGIVEILIYDEIGYGGWFYEGVTAQSMVNQLKDIEADKIRVRINSPGGDVFEGVAILNALRAHPAHVTTIVDGLAASAASFIAMAGDEIVMARNAEMMIHDPSGLCVGNAADMRDLAEQLDRIGDNIASMYSDRAGGTVDEWRTAMRAETWYSDEEAVSAGLANRIERFDKQDDAAAKNRFDLSVFNFAGRGAAPAPPVTTSKNTTVTNSVTRNSSAAEAEADRKGRPMATLQEALVERLGIAADADEETIIAAVDEALAEQTNESGSGAGSEGEGAPAEPTAEQFAAYARTNGLVVVDQTQHAQIVAAANEGRAARAQQLREADERIVDTAIGEGRFPPARREHWLNSLAADREGTTATIASLAKGLVPVAEIGHGQDIDNSVDVGNYSWPGTPASKEA